MSVKIAHIADIHYRGMSRHVEYREILTRFAEQVVVEKVDHILIAGDLFHTKTTGISPEFIEQFGWFLDKLASAAHVHIILGNHDGSLVNLSRQDAITPIVNMLNDDHVHLYKQSGVYEFAPHMHWCVFSLFDKKNWDNIAPVKGDVNIACYHGPIKGANTPDGWVITDGLSTEFFKDYDFVMLGDIHHTQYLEFRDVELVIDEEDLCNYPNAEIVEKL